MHRNAESREPGHEYEWSSTAVLNQGSQVGKQDERTDASQLDKAEYLEPAAWIPANDNESEHQHSDS